MRTTPPSRLVWAIRRRIQRLEQTVVASHIECGSEVCARLSAMTDHLDGIAAECGIDDIEAILTEDESSSTELSSLLALPPELQKPPARQSLNLTAEGLTHGLSRKGYRSYSLSEKQAALDLFKSGLKYRQISELLWIPSKNIMRWCKLESRMLRDARGRRCLDSLMEERLIIYLQERIDTGSAPTEREIKDKALTLSTVPDFKASRSWLHNFLRRCSLEELVQQNTELKTEE